MENSKIIVSNPCNKDWNKMTNHNNGKYCGSCNKTVIDFTSWEESHFSDHRHEILQYRFEQNRFHENKIGMTKNKYSSSEDLLKKIIQNENIPSGKINHREHVYFNNYSGEILVK